jgi:hypothetical protein
MADSSELLLEMLLMLGRTDAQQSNFRCGGCETIKGTLSKKSIRLVCTKFQGGELKSLE